MSENHQSQDEKSQDGLKIRKKQAAAAVTAEAPAEPAAQAEDVKKAEPGFDTSKLSRRVVDPRTSAGAAPKARKPAPQTTFEAEVSTQDFAAMFEGGADASAKVPERRFFDLGEQIEAQITHIDARYIFVDLGTRGEARAPRSQYEDEEGNLEVEVGQTHSFFILKFTREGIEVGKQLDTRQSGLGAIEDAMTTGLPLQGRVTSKNKGGFVVEVGGVEAFCPVSQIDLHNADELDVYLNQTFSFKVLEVRDNGRSVVVSRAAQLREEAAKQREATLAQIEPGAILTGIVRSISDFGAFINLGGVDGLVHISEMSWGNTSKPSDIVTQGESVEVKVLEIEQRPGKNSPRISLSMKQVQEDPWGTVNERFHTGMQLEGVVVRTAPFGAFVEIAPGIDGLVHVSQMSWEHVRRAEDVVRVGDSVSVEILDIDLIRQRISLSMKSVQGDPWSKAEEDFPIGAEVEGVVEKIEDFGVFVNLGTVTALLPRSEMSLGRNETPHTKGRKGATLKARVLSVDTERRRMALTLRDAEDIAQDDRRPARRDDSRSSKRSQRDSSAGSQRSYSDSPAGSFGTLGDLLKSRKK